MLADPQELRASQLSKRLPPLHNLDGLWGYLNSKGEVRLDSVRNPRDAPALDLSSVDDQVTLVRLFREWVTDDDHVILESEDEETRERALHLIKAAKRGNDVAVGKIADRLRDLEANVAAFSGFPMTGVLFATLTYDPKEVPGGAEDAWRRAGPDFNRFMSAVRKWARTAARGAKVFAHRSWEAHKSGWPHVHVVLCFDKIGFLVWEQRRNDEQTTYRVGDDTNRKLRDLWGHGFVDVQAVPSGKVAQRLRDILWYVTKDTSEADYREIESWTWKKLLGLAIGWYLGLRLWSASRLLTLRPWSGGGEPAHDFENVPHPEAAPSWRCARCGTVQAALEGGKPPTACPPELGGCGRAAGVDTRFVPADFEGELVRDRFQEHVDREGYNPRACLTCRKAWIAGSAGEFTRAVEATQTNLVGEAVADLGRRRTKWTFVGMVKGRNTDVPGDEWHRIVPLPPRRHLRRPADALEKIALCSECGRKAVGLLHLDDADEDVALCKAHGDEARDAYPEYARPPTAWVPKRMKRHAGGNMAEAFA